MQRKKKVAISVWQYCEVALYFLNTINNMLSRIYGPGRISALLAKQGTANIIYVELSVSDEAFITW